jgi:iron complex transport system substrate-binding protein
MRPALVCALASIALAATACGERPEPVAADLSLYPVEVRGAGDEPTLLAERPERIAALAPGAAELLAAMGAGDRLVGIPAGVSVPEAPGARELTRPSGLVDVEALSRVDADLVVASPANDTEDVGRALRRSPAALYLSPEGSIADVRRATLELGLLAGEPVAAREVARAMEERIADVQASVAELVPARVFVDTGFLITMPDDSLTADVVRHAGGELVGTEAAGEPVEPCDLLELAPDVVLTFDAGLAERSQAAFQRCDPAPAEAPEFIEVDADLLTRAGPRVADALEQIAEILHPAAFPG